jgi:hypothetical protein
VNAYAEPQFGPDDRATAADCFARAQRALEMAEMNLDNILAQVGGRLATGESLAHTKVRAQIGQGWTELGAALRGAR